MAGRTLCIPLVFALAFLSTGCIEIDDEVHFCSEAEREVEVCTQEYNPVCGWYHSEVECETTPCATTEPNPCYACKNPDVEFWTWGECPENRSY